jgi:hypothetical protein
MRIQQDATYKKYGSEVSPMIKQHNTEVNITQEEVSKPAENLCSKFIAQKFSHLETSITSIPVLIQYIGLQLESRRYRW